MNSTSPLLCLLGITVLVDTYSLYIPIDKIHPTVCLTAYGIYTLSPAIVAMTHSPAPPADRLLGKSPEWVTAYTQAYQKRIKRHRTDASVLGCVTGGVVFIGAIYALNSYFVGAPDGID